MKYKYTGGLSAEMIAGKETVLYYGQNYDLDEKNKQVQTLVKLGYLEEIKTPETKGNK